METRQKAILIWQCVTNDGDVNHPVFRKVNRSKFFDIKSSFQPIAVN